MRFSCRNIVPRHICRKRDPRKTYCGGRTKFSTRMVFSCAKNVWNDISHAVNNRNSKTRSKKERVAKREKERKRYIIRPSATDTLNYQLVMCCFHMRVVSRINARGWNARDDDYVVILFHDWTK